MRIPISIVSHLQQQYSYSSTEITAQRYTNYIFNFKAMTRSSLFPFGKALFPGFKYRASLITVSTSNVLKWNLALLGNLTGCHSNRETISHIEVLGYVAFLIGKLEHLRFLDYLDSIYSILRSRCDFAFIGFAFIDGICSYDKTGVKLVTNGRMKMVIFLSVFYIYCIKFIFDWLPFASVHIAYNRLIPHPFIAIDAITRTRCWNSKLMPINCLQQLFTIGRWSELFNRFPIKVSFLYIC